jgi:glucan phosphoethanolaminetransferase (alkaline phosphatase superfamily)
MYIKQVIRNKSNWGLYLLGIFVIIPIMMIIFQIPFTVALTSAAIDDPDLLEKLAQNDVNAMMSVLEPNLNLFLMLLGFAGMLLGVFISAKYIHKNSIRELTTSRDKIDWSRGFFFFYYLGTYYSTTYFNRSKYSFTRKL